MSILGDILAYFDMPSIKYYNDGEKEILIMNDKSVRKKNKKKEIFQP
ncbi:MAG: hypothetical protein V1740_05340 [Candidatus Woesearchaeota archaeon]